MIEARRQQLLHAIVDEWDSRFDPEVALLPPPAAHSENLDYALALLETAERSRMGRAEALIRRVLDRLPGDETGFPLLLIWHRHRRRLTPEVAGKIREAICRTAEKLARRDDARAVDRMAFAKIFVSLASAEIEDDSRRLGQGRARLDSLAAETKDRATVPDAGMALAGLHAIATYVRDPHARWQAGRLLEKIWSDVAGRLPETEGEGGLLEAMIERASQGASRHVPEIGPCAWEALYACVMNVDAPSRVAVLLSAKAAAPAGFA